MHSADKVISDPALQYKYNTSTHLLLDHNREATAFPVKQKVYFSHPETNGYRDNEGVTRIMTKLLSS